MRRAESRLKGVKRPSITLVFMPPGALNFDATRVTAEFPRAWQHAVTRIGVPKRNTVFLSETVDRGQTARICAAIRSRIAGAGRRPSAALRLSARCWGRLVPGMTHVTDGSARIHLRKNCAQLSQSNSAAHGGTPWARTRWKSPP